MSATPATGATLRTGSWMVQTEHSRASFTVGNLGKAVEGTVPVRAGELVVDASGAPRRLTATLDLAGLDTANARRDKDLRRRGLLDLDAHPTMTFVSERIDVDEQGWTAQGTLTARGTSCPLTVRGGLPGQPGDDGSVVVEGTAVLDRRDLGIRAPRLMIGRQVSIRVTARLVG
ncbi:YceI family protein [Angustibacter sp. McL0619]|uniref:YceI family protein n=1 Tax=Angustibacter sp. McL0619 TaxID=3415676 RepID=UPI003CE8B073